MKTMKVTLLALSTLALCTSALAANPGKFSIKSEGAYEGSENYVRESELNGRPCSIEVRSLKTKFLSSRIKSLEAYVPQEAGVLKFECSGGIDTGYGCVAYGKNYAITLSPESYLSGSGPNDAKYKLPEYSVYDLHAKGNSKLGKFVVTCEELKKR